MCGGVDHRVSPGFRCNQVRVALYHRPVCGGVDQCVGRCNQVRMALLHSKQCDIFQYNTFLGALGPTHSVFGQLRR